MRRFWSDRRGNVALVFALAAIPIFGAMGAAVDYSMASAYRSDIQKALDATALALTKIMPAEQATLDQFGNQFFQANLKNHNLKDLQLTIQPDIGTLRVSATATYEVQMAKIIGASTIDLGASAEAKWSIGKVEIALALDNSWSMNSLGRMTQLKAASHDLLNVLETAAREPDDAKVAIIPFDAVVNVGTQHVEAEWLRWNHWDSLNQNHLWPAGIQNLNYDVNDVEPDATHPFDHASETLAQRRTKVPAARCYSANNPPQQITPLTEDWTLLKQRANALTPTGWTNITIGMTWSFHLLSPTPLFTEGAAHGTEDLTKYVILMTDGYNTKSVWKEPGSCPTTGPCPDIDARTEAVCNNIKATNNIQIFTVRLMQGNETLLRNCASNPGMYHDVQAAGQLAGVFTAIGSEIASLHLSK